jgi:hypothetical protein
MLEEGRSFAAAASEGSGATDSGDEEESEKFEHDDLREISDDGFEANVDGGEILLNSQMLRSPCRSRCGSDTSGNAQYGVQPCIRAVASLASLASQRPVTHQFLAVECEI